MNTLTVKVDKDRVEDSRESLIQAAEIIKKGGLVVFPTETVYGLGGDATNKNAAKKIYEAKGRPSDNPLIIHIATPREAEKYTFTSPLFYALAKRFMPGPLTVIMRARDTVPKETRGGLPTVAVRCPENPIARRLIELSETPIAAPSANLSGSPSPTNAIHVAEDMLGRVDMIIDGGDCEIGLESTIVKIESDETLTLLRPGKITPQDLRLVADLNVSEAVTDKLKEGEKALSPGMKYRHYAPKAPLVLLDANTEGVISYIKNMGEEKVALISYSEEAEELSSALLFADIYILGSRNDEQEQAKNLFRILRDTDKKRYEKIYAPLPEKQGMGLALYNRMIRAAAHSIIKVDGES